MAQLEPDGPPLRTDGVHFRESAGGRTVILRGVNFSAAAKFPKGQPLHRLEGFWDTAEKDGEPGAEEQVTYVGQLVDLQDPAADEHFARLRRWGFNCVRLIVVWEALEHQGPGRYDEHFMDYVVAVLRKCQEFGLYVYIDPHQDLFSRFCGGSGAPLWAVLACGLNPRRFTETGAAYLHAEWPDTGKPDPASFPAMMWATNYARLANLTVNTLFWAGKEYAPLCQINGVNIQDFLQTHFLRAFGRLAERIAAAGGLLDSTLVGWDSVNEPNRGFLETGDLAALSKRVVLRIGPTPTPFETMRLGMGEALAVENYRVGLFGSQKAGTAVVNRAGASAWLDAAADDAASLKYGWKRAVSWPMGSCIWAAHGVWDPATRALLKPDYFAFSRSSPGRPARFAEDHWRPHLVEYASTVRTHHPEAIVFVHPPVFEIPPDLHPPAVPSLGDRVVFSSHFYDGLTLITRRWNWFNADAVGFLRGKYASVMFAIRIGEGAIRRSLRQQLATLRKDGLDHLGDRPFMMGEIGIPFDLDNKRAYREGDFTSQEKALDASLNACDGENMLNYTIWNYCTQNSHKWGDGWNGEDLSIWSADDQRAQGGKRRRGADTPSSSTSHISLTEAPPSSNKSAQADAAPDLPASPDPFDGSRAPRAFIRPFPVRTRGRPLSFSFDIATATFRLEVFSDAKPDSEDLPTEIFVPSVHFGTRVEASSPDHQPRLDVQPSAGRWEIKGETLLWFAPAGRQSIQIRRELPLNGSGW